MNKALLTILLLLPISAYAHKPYQAPVTNVYNSTSNIYNQEGVALAIAMAQHQFDWGTHSWQGSVGLGSYAGNDAISLGVAKRFDRTLITGSLGRTGADYGFGISINWRF